MSATHVVPSASTLQNVWTIVVAGGSGVRFGTRKQFAEIGGETVLQRSVSAAEHVSEGVVVVVPSDAVDDVDLRDSVGHQLVVAGGATRAESVRAGLAAVPESAAVVLVHDAARPLASPVLFAAVVDAVQSGAVAVVPVVEVADTMREVDGGPVDRSKLRAVQTPQGFEAGTLRRAHLSNPDATDDATLVEVAGESVTLIDGEAANRKITNPVDLVMADAVLAGIEDS